MDGGAEARASARLDEVLRRIQERKNMKAANDAQGAPASLVSVGTARDVFVGDTRRPDFQRPAPAGDHRGLPSPELHYALLGLVSFAVVLLIVIVVLLARRDLRPIKPSDASSLSTVVLFNPSDATFFLFLLGPMGFKVRC